MTKAASASGAAHNPMIRVVNNDVPTDPEALIAKREEQADAAIASAETKINKLEQFVATAPKGHKQQQREHLAGAKQALAEAIAAKERIV